MYEILDPAGLRKKIVIKRVFFGIIVYKTTVTSVARIVIKTNHKLCKSRLKTDNVMYKD